MTKKVKPPAKQKKPVDNLIVGSEMRKERVLAIPDLHLPFGHKDALPFVSAIYSKYKPTKVVFLGDEIDNHFLSEYVHDPDAMSAEDEFASALDQFKEYYKVFEEEEEVLVCESNHTVRPLKKASKAGIPTRFLREYREFLEAPEGWRWGQSWEIDGVVYEHGESYSGREGAIRTAEKNMASTVIGHIHSKAGIQFTQSTKKLFWGFNVGCLIDDKTYAFKYAKHVKDRPVLGAGLIFGSVPMFFPMLLDKHGRWTGKLLDG